MKPINIYKYMYVEFESNKIIIANDFTHVKRAMDSCNKRK